MTSPHPRRLRRHPLPSPKQRGEGAGGEVRSLDQAKALLQAALLSVPQDARLYYNLGPAALQRGDAETARAHFERAAELAPEWDP